MDDSNTRTTKDESSPPPSRDGAQATTRISRASKLRYRRRSIWLLSCYLPILVVPWCLTCVMMFRPVFLPSYVNQSGSYSMDDMYSIDRWLTAVNIMNKIASTLGIPVVSALVAQAAVVYSQRRYSDQKLSALQLFALADRGWTDMPILWNSWTKPGPTESSGLLWVGVGMVFITAIQPALQSLLVPTDSILAVTCKDNPVKENNPSPSCSREIQSSKVVGYDPEPAELEHCPQDLVTQKVLEKIISQGYNNIQPHMWLDPMTDDHKMPLPELEQEASSFGWISSLSNHADRNPTFYASPIANGTLTGVLRQHALRMNSTIHCARVLDFPDPCPGDRPFFTSFTPPNGLPARICTGGNYSEMPWTTSRDRQDVTEYLWVALGEAKTQVVRRQNFTMRCEAKTTRGYFELGNYRNNFNAGPLLDIWPSVGELERDFNDYASTYARNQGDADKDFYPSKMPPSYSYGHTSYQQTSDFFGTAQLPTPGPLMTAALSIFGNGTFFHSANRSSVDDFNQTARGLCTSRRLPFTRFDLLHWSPCYWPEDMEGTAPPQLPAIIQTFIELFSDEKKAEEMLKITMFLANEALLTTTASEGEGWKSRYIYSSPGWTVLKPRKSLEGLIVISVLIGAQVVCLVALVRYICSVPTWTGQLDAFALAQIGAQLGEVGGRGLSEAELSDTRRLAYMDGLVGFSDFKSAESTALMVDSDPSSPTRNSQTFEARQTESRNVSEEGQFLAVGGAGLISTAIMPQRWKLWR